MLLMKFVILLFKFHRVCSVDNTSALGQIAAWSRTGDKLLSEPKMGCHTSALFCNRKSESWKFDDISGLVQDCSISGALAMEILQSCTTKPSTWYSRKWRKLFLCTEKYTKIAFNEETKIIIRQLMIHCVKPVFCEIHIHLNTFCYLYIFILVPCIPEYKQCLKHHFYYMKYNRAIT